MSFELLEHANLRRFHSRLTLLSAAGTFLDGFDLTVIAVALPLLVKQWHISAGLSGLVGSSAVIGMLVGSVVLGHLTDRIGRRAMYLIDLLCFVVFAAMTAFSQNVTELLIFRFLLGLGIGADYPISSTLLAEFSPKARRGGLVTTLGAMWFVGAAVAYIVGLLLLGVGPNAWRFMMLVGAALALVVIGYRSAIPESPRWLVNHGRTDEAKNVIASLTGERPRKLPRTATRKWADLFSPQLLRRTVFVAGFWFCYDVAFYGISIYTPTVLKSFTVGSQALADLGAAAVSVIGLIGALIGLRWVDSWGRRPLMLLAFGGLSVALLVLTAFPTPALGVLVVLFGLAELFANMGPGVLDFVYPTELFPTGVRAGATGFATAVSRVGAILGIVVFPGLVKSWGLSAALSLFTVAGLLGLFISWRLAPETKGSSLESLSEEVDQGVVAQPVVPGTGSFPRGS